MSENTSSTRRLAAILFADIQGYTALMQKDEKKASILLRRFQEQLKKGVNENNGEIVNFYGDGALCLFDFPKAAIHCAIEMQRIFTNNPHVPVRIGIHTGSVVQEGEKVFGHSVNIASRIESIGVPGSILFSEKVRDDIRNHQEFQITSLGNFQFKNVDEPLSVYAISNQGIIVPKKSEIHGKLRPKSPTTPWWILAAIAFLIAAYFMIPLLSKTGSKSIKATNGFLDDAQIAIGVFENNSVFPEYNIVGKMASDWIAHGIIENQIAPVITYQAIDQYSEISQAGIGIDQILNASADDVKVLRGVFYIADTNLIFQCSIVDQATGQAIYAFENVSCHRNRPLEGIQKLHDQIMGYWAVKDDQYVTTSPPTYSAYELYLKAKDVWSEDYTAADSLLKKSIASDPEFPNSKFLLAHLYYNMGQYEMLDSLVAVLETEFELKNPVKANVISYLRALLDGNNRSIFETFKKEYNTAPKDLFNNTGMMVIALNYARNPDLVMEVFNEIDNDLLDYGSCYYCVVRAEVMAAALISSGQEKKAIRLLEPLLDQTDKRGPRDYLIKAFLRTGDIQKLDDMLSIAYGQDLNLGSEYLYFLAAHEAQLLGLEEIQMKYAREAIDKYNALERKNEVMLGRSYYILEDFDMAKSLFESLLKKRPNHIFSLSKLASIAFMAGDDKLAYSFISKIRENKNEYDFGYSSYFIAQAYAQGKKYTEAFKILGEAVKEGDVLSAIDYENDPLFKEMHAMPQWVSIVNYWSDQYRN